MKWVCWRDEASSGYRLTLTPLPASDDIFTKKKIIKIIKFVHVMHILYKLSGNTFMVMHTTNVTHPTKELPLLLQSRKSFFVIFHIVDI